jgi:hypothetical protein
MRLIGTGKDPRYPKGLVFDSADGTREQESIVAAGWATVGEHDGEAPGHFGDQRTVEIANAAVRGDAMLLPHEQEVADKIEGNELAIVHTGDAKAVAGDDVKAAVKARKVGHLGAEPGDQKDVKHQQEAIETDAPAEAMHRRPLEAKAK